MLLELTDKELAAIGASIGANCGPCIEHHFAAGRDVGLSQAELESAVATAYDLRREAVELLSAQIDALLARGGPPPKPTAIGPTSKARELIALGVSVGANCHPMLHFHVGAANDIGLDTQQIRSALKTAEYVQQVAAEITAHEVIRALAERVGAPAESAAAK